VLKFKGDSFRSRSKVMSMGGYMARQSRVRQFLLLGRMVKLRRVKLRRVKLRRVKLRRVKLRRVRPHRVRLHTVKLLRMVKLI
jgi:hypothetical protein